MGIELLILGSNSAAFAHRRHHTAQLLKIQDLYFLIDCGEGTQLLLKKNKVKLSKIDHILISHLHGDHYFGLIGLLSTMHLFGRQKQLVLIGPPGLSEIIGLQLKYSDTSLAFDIDFREFEPDQTEMIYENQRLTVTTIPMDHRVPCSGYLFEEKPKRRRLNSKATQGLKLAAYEIIRMKEGHDVLKEDGSVKYAYMDYTLPPAKSQRYAYCSDSKIKPTLLDQLKGVDLMYHEATFTSDMEARAEQTYHSTARQAAQLGKDAEVGRLLLGHFSARYRELDPILEEARQVYARAELAIEGQRFIIDEK